MKFIDLKILDNTPNDWSHFFDYKEDQNYLNREAEKIGSDFENLIVIGNGGSVTSFNAYSICTKIDTWVVNSMDPALLRKVKRSCPVAKSLVVAISKSGNTLGVIESLLEFVNYRTIVITESEDGALRQLANKLNWQVIEHPNIPGRYSGGTAAGLFPALLAGVKIDEVINGIESGYKYKKEAYNLAKYYFNLEAKGYNEVYISAYPWLLKDFRTLIIQLMHESVCKNGRGQTFYFSEAPECQHHTNQRLFGGRKNVIATFITIKSWRDDKEIKVPKQIEELEIKGVPLKKLDGISQVQALNLEYHGAKTEADRLNIPNVTIELEDITNKTVGELLSFWQLVAFYSAILRGVSPFDEPAVNNSKKNTIEEFKKL